MKRILKYLALVILIAAVLFLPSCDCDGTTGPEPYGGPWKSIPCPEGPSYLEAVFFLKPNLGYAVGCRHILKYDGDKWKVDFAYKENSERYSIAFEDVWFNDPEDGWVVGNEWDNEKRESSALLLHYNGLYWRRVIHNMPTSGLHSVFFLTPNDGWAAGTGIVHWDGDSWNYLSDIGFLEDIYFNTPNDGWAVSYYGPKIYHYDGATWEKVFEQSMHHGFGMYFQNENRGWAAGGRTLLLEYVNGKWTEYTRTENLAYCEAVHFAADGAGWAVGQRTYKWNESENKWLYVEAPFPRGTLYDVFVLSEGDAWAVGDAQILHYQP